MIHIKETALSDKALCGEGGDLAWTTRTSARALCDCPECLREVFADNCKWCNGNKGRKEYDEWVECPHCSLGVVEDFNA